MLDTAIQEKKVNQVMDGFPMLLSTNGMMVDLGFSAQLFGVLHAHCSTSKFK